MASTYLDFDNMTKDQRHWKQFTNGDQLALASIYFDHAEALVQYGRKFTAKYEVIEDTLQEVFLSLLRTRKTLTIPDNIRHYLLFAFRNSLIRELKRLAKNKETAKFDENSFIIQFNIEQDLSQDTIARQRSKLIGELMESLSSRQREAIYLRFKNELTHQEIATIMNITEQVSRNLISQAIKRMKQQIDTQNINIELLILYII